MKEWKKGDFAYSKGRTLVRLQDHPNAGMFGIEYVANYESGAGVTCGGYSSAFPSELSIVTDLQDIVTCRVYAALFAAKAAENEMTKQKKIAEVNQAALAVIRDAKLAEAEAKAHAAAELQKVAAGSAP